MAELFTVPFDAQGMSQGGAIVATQPADRIYLLSFQGGPDNRLVPNFLHAFMLALDIIEVKYPPGVVVSTSSIAKFYSNGLDLGLVADTPTFWSHSLLPLMRRLLTFPMPTIALLNGHAFAGGFVVAMCHDYRIMNPAKGFLCMNEVEFSVCPPPALIHIFKDKVSPQVLRDIFQAAQRYPGPEALKVGIVDELGGLDETIAFVQKRNLLKTSQSGNSILSNLKEDMWRYTLGTLDNAADTSWRDANDERQEQRQDKTAAAVAAWEGGAKAKL